jgi:hypothetical protein
MEQNSNCQNYTDLELINHAVRHVRAAACRTTNKFGSPNQQKEIKNVGKIANGVPLF